jgi:hypothetical protein
MKTLFLALFSAFLITFAFTNNAKAQDQYSFCVTVYQPSGCNTPRADANVTVYYGDQIIFSGTTDQNGRKCWTTYPNMPTGNYKIVATYTCELGVTYYDYEGGFANITLCMGNTCK